jgi:6-phosphogluconolactonase (cycloisomerase 2 family)
VAVDGSLTAGPIAHTVDNQAAWIAADPVGPFVYVTDTGLNGLVGYQVNAGGSLSQLSTVPCGQNVRSLVVDPLGRWCYVATLGGNVIQLNISASGTLTQQQSTNVASSVDAMAIDPGGRFLFVVNSGAASITTLSIGSDGTLSPAASSTAGVGHLPSSITVTPLASAVAGRSVVRRSIRR